MQAYVNVCEHERSVHVLVVQLNSFFSHVALHAHVLHSQKIMCAQAHIVRCVLNSSLQKPTKCIGILTLSINGRI